MIPKIINHIWLQGEYPKRYINNYDIWSNLHPNWEHKVWNEKELVLLCNKEQVIKYSKLSTLINRVNFLKYILMYNVGGVYGDLDSFPIKTIDSLLEQDEIKDIDIESLLSIRFPLNIKVPIKKFKKYNIILPARNTLSFYPNGDKVLLLDNPFLISNKNNSFWLNLIDFCEKRTNIKSAFDVVLPHEPLGPYGMTDFLFKNYKNPIEEGILVIPPIYWCKSETKSSNVYIIHEADGGW